MNCAPSLAGRMSQRRRIVAVGLVLETGDWSSGPVFSTMTSIIAPALLLPPLLLLLASSANEQVRVVCVLSSAVTRPRSRRAADAVKNAVVASLGVGHCGCRVVPPRHLRRIVLAQVAVCGDAVLSARRLRTSAVSRTCPTLLCFPTATSRRDRLALFTQQRVQQSTDVLVCMCTLNVCHRCCRASPLLRRRLRQVPTAH